MASGMRRRNKMKISTDSWHYKLIDTISVNFPSENLCNYFWQLIFALIVSTILITVICFVTLLMLSPVLQFFIELNPVYIIIGGVVDITLLSGTLIESIRERRKYSNKKPSICIEYIKAKKHKYCPKIEFVEEE